jgi:hypothetical protein
LNEALDPLAVIFLVDSVYLERRRHARAGKTRNEKNPAVKPLQAIFEQGGAGKQHS